MGALVGLQNLGSSVPREVSGAAALDLLRDDVIRAGMPARRVELACHMVERQSTGLARTI